MGSTDGPWCFRYVVLLVLVHQQLRRKCKVQNCPAPVQETVVFIVKNHFYEMKGDVGMSLHEKERNKKMPTPRHKVTHNPIPTSLFCFNMLFVCLL